jgi:hypothetical protein
VAVDRYPAGQNACIDALQNVPIHKTSNVNRIDTCAKTLPIFSAPTIEHVPMSDERSIPRWLSITAAVSTLSVPFFYIFGYAYDQGYLHTFGVSNEFFARSPQEYLVLAFYACLGLATLTLETISNNGTVFLAIAIVSGVIAWGVVFVHKRHVGERLTRKTIPLKEHRFFDYIFFPVLFASMSYALPVAFASSIFLVLLVPAVSYFKGVNDAEKEIAKAKPCQYSEAPTEGCVALIENGKPVGLGMFVARSQSHLALYAAGKTSIFPVKDQLVEVAPVPRSPNPAAPGIPHDEAAPRP